MRNSEMSSTPPTRATTTSQIVCPLELMEIVYSIRFDCVCVRDQKIRQTTKRNRPSAECTTAFFRFVPFRFVIYLWHFEISVEAINSLD